MQFVISCCFRILADYENIFVLITRQIVLEIYDVMREAGEEVNIEKRAILVTLNDSVSHVRITCGQPDVVTYTATDYWQETCSYDCNGLPSTYIALFRSIKRT